LAFSSCSKEHIKGNGTTVTETRTVSGFSKIDASGSSKVYITQGAVFKVEVKGYSNLLPYYETKQVNNTLQLGYKQDVNVKNDNIEVYVTLPALTGLELEGSGDIHTAEYLRAMQHLKQKFLVPEIFISATALPINTMLPFQVVAIFIH
jgi:hypothetical protein